MPTPGPECCRSRWWRRQSPLPRKNTSCSRSLLSQEGRSRVPSRGRPDTRFSQPRPGESRCRYPRQTGLSLPKRHAVFILEAGGDRHRLFRRIRKRLVFQYRDGARSPHRRMSPSLHIQSAAGTPAKQRAAAPAFSNSSTLTPPPCPVGSSGIMMAGLLKTDHILWRVMEA